MTEQRKNDRTNDFIDLSALKSTGTVTPPKILIYGTPGCGKSTFAARAKNVDKILFLDLENGHSAIKKELGDRYNGAHISDFGMFHSVLNSLQTRPHDYKYLVIDTVDWLETIVHNEVCRKYNARSIYDGSNQMTNYNKGPGLAKKELDDILAKLDLLITSRGICVILLAHAQISKSESLEDGTEKVYSMKTMDKMTSKLFTEWPDIIAFAKRPITTDMLGKKTEGDPVLFFKSHVAVVKARTLHELPESIPFKIDEFWKTYNAANSPKEGN